MCITRESIQNFREVLPLHAAPPILMKEIKRVQDSHRDMVRSATLVAEGPDLPKVHHM